MSSLTALLGSYPHTEALKSAAVAIPGKTLEFHDLTPVHRGFRAMVEDQAYDVAEIAIGAFFQALDAGRPLRLLPVVTLAGFHHGSIYRTGSAEALAPEQLAGRRVAVRSYSQTTGIWVRGLLEEEHGLDPKSVTWVTLEGSHESSYEDPPNVVRAAGDQDLPSLLRSGDVQAAILGGGKQPDEFVQFLPSARSAATAWYARHRLVPVNHMVAVPAPTPPDVVAELHDAFRRSYAAAPAPTQPSGITTEIGAIWPGVEMGLELARRQGIVRSRYSAADVFAAGSTGLEDVS